MIPCFHAKIKNLAFIAFLVLSLFSCKTDLESTVPANFFGIRNSFNTFYSDTIIDLKTYTVKMDSIASYRLSAFAIGAINDPMLGKTKASLVMQYGLPTNQFTWAGVPKLDSVVLQLRFRTQPKSDGTYLDDYYGDRNAIHTLKVYALDEDISWDSVYYSTKKPKLGMEVGSWTGTYNFVDSFRVTLGQQIIVLPPHIRITLSDAYKAYLFGAEARGDFLNSTTFKTAFKGFVVVDESNLGPKEVNPNQMNKEPEGAVVFVNLHSDVTALTAYSDSLAVDFPVIAGSEAAYNYYEQDTVPNMLQYPLVNGKLVSCLDKDICFAQPLAGTKVRVEMPNIYSVLNNPKLAIQGAEIIFEVLPGSNTGDFNAPQQLSLVGSDSLGRNIFLKDQIFEGGVYYGGTFNTNYNQYHFNIVRHIQYLLDSYKTGQDYNYGMNLIVSADNPVTAQRVVFDTRKNNGSVKGKVRLKLTYTYIK